MNEWSVVVALTALASLFFMFYTPLGNRHKEEMEERKRMEADRIAQEKEAAAAREANTKAISELNASLKIFSEHFSKVEEANHESHQKIYERLNEKSKVLASHDQQLKDHERRLSHLEGEK